MTSWQRTWGEQNLEHSKTNNNHLATETLRMIRWARELDKFSLYRLATLSARVQSLQVIPLTHHLAIVQGVVHIRYQAATVTAGLLHSLQGKGFTLYRNGLSFNVFCYCHLVVLLTDELVEEGEVGAVESVPAHRAGHAVFMVIFTTGYHAVSDNRPAADATCSLLALTGDLLIFAQLIAVFTSSEHFPQTNLLSRVIILPSMTSSQWLHL